MLKMGSRRAGFALALCATVATAACRKNDSGTADTGLAGAYTTAAATADTGMAAAPAPAALSDANIFHILDNANKLDSAAGSIAATKGTAADVRDFGKRMMLDHHAMRKEGEDLAKKLKIIPEASANDNSQATYDKTMATLDGAAKGKDFDKAYIDGEVAGHMAVLQTLTSAMPAAGSAELKNLIQKAAPKVQEHFDLAKSIQARMK